MHVDLSNLIVLVVAVRFPRRREVLVQPRLDLI